ncbi:MAG TPA: TonB-dependent receptor plug domain-containing protein, partial [Burkholderiales bacterium]|nr:TonB-dependent receptor plug domain-containing protein [Burkholderiales bacterium]
MQKKIIIMLATALLPLAMTAAIADDQSGNPSNSGTALTEAEKAQKRAQLLQELEAIKSELKQLDSGTSAATTTETAPATPAAGSGKTLGEVVVISSKPKVFEHPSGQTVTTIDRDKYKNSPAFTIGDVLTLTPGVTVTQGNGPRDISVSVRGSNARQTFGIRNIQVFEDGFPVTQPDGLARTDLIDPHSYGNIDVYQGPSSALFGNYATGGAINFQTRPGDDIRGAELSLDAGSYGYRNEYVTVGNKKDQHEYTLFASHVSGDGSTDHTGFNTTTENFIATYAPTAADKYTFKFVNNDLDTDLSIRL